MSALVFVWVLVATIGGYRVTLGDYRSASACNAALDAVLADDPNKQNPFLKSRQGVCVRVPAAGRVVTP